MKIWVMFSLLGATALLFFSDSGRTSESDVLVSHQVDKTEENQASDNAVPECWTHWLEAKNWVGSVSLEDYQPADPSPSSKTAVKPGPIEHGAPLMPYLPSPGPPACPPEQKR